MDHHFPGNCVFRMDLEEEEMTSKVSIEDVQKWALESASRYKQELIDAPDYHMSEYGRNLSSNGEEKGRYQVAVDLCIFLGVAGEME